MIVTYAFSAAFVTSVVFRLSSGRAWRPIAVDGWKCDDHSVDGLGMLDLHVAAAQFFDASFWMTLGAALLISTAAFIVMHIYVRTLFRESQRSASDPQFGPGVEDGVLPPRTTTGSLTIETGRADRRTSGPPPRSPTFRNAESAFRRAARLYALGGSIHAATSVSLLFLFGRYSLPHTRSRLTIVACCVAVFWSWFSITMIALALFWGPDRRLRGLVALGYFGMLPGMGVLLLLAGTPALPLTDVGLMAKDEAALLLSFASAVMRQPVAAEAVMFSPLSQPLLFWALSAFPVFIPFLAFNRFVRGTVGPLFINIALAMLLSGFFIVDLAIYTSPGLWLTTRMKLVFGGSTFRVLMAVSLALAAIIAFAVLLWIARYRRMHLSDQTFLFDALWLSASLYVSIFLMGDRKPFVYLIGLVPFAVYKMTVAYGLKRLQRRAQALPEARLLFLRVFGPPSRSEKLFDLLAARWRYAGSIQLIATADVARGRFEPDEFLDFLNGQLASAYINSGTDVNRRLKSLDSRPDPDGRHRIHEFFCRGDTWQETVAILMKQSDLVVMDLRGFNSQRKGSLFEVRALLDEVLLYRVVLLIDQTTDEPFLKQTLADFWRSLSPRSPNAQGASARLAMIDLAGSYPAAVRRLMNIGDEIVAGSTRYQ